MNEQRMIHEMDKELDTLRRQLDAARKERDELKRHVKKLQSVVLDEVARISQDIESPPAEPKPEPKCKRCGDQGWIDNPSTGEAGAPCPNCSVPTPPTDDLEERAREFLIDDGWEDIDDEDDTFVVTCAAFARWVREDDRKQIAELRAENDRLREFSAEQHADTITQLAARDAQLAELRAENERELRMYQRNMREIESLRAQLAARYTREEIEKAGAELGWPSSCRVLIARMEPRPCSPASSVVSETASPASTARPSTASGQSSAGSAVAASEPAVAEGPYSVVNGPRGMFYANGPHVGMLDCGDQPKLWVYHLNSAFAAGVASRPSDADWRAVENEWEKYRKERAALGHTFSERERSTAIAFARKLLGGEQS